MSLKTWKEEFYSVEASEVSKEDALDHSIRKWEGLSAENRKRHRVKVDSWGDLVDDDDMLSVDGSSCAMCCVYLDDTKLGVGECGSCPIVSVRGTACCMDLPNKKGNPYDSWSSRHQSLPMLNLLKKVKAAQK